MKKYTLLALWGITSCTVLFSMNQVDQKQLMDSGRQMIEDGCIEQISPRESITSVAFACKEGNGLLIGTSGGLVTLLVYLGAPYKGAGQCSSSSFFPYEIGKLSGPVKKLKYTSNELGRASILAQYGTKRGGNRIAMSVLRANTASVQWSNFSGVRGARSIENIVYEPWDESLWYNDKKYSVHFDKDTLRIKKIN